MKVVYIISKKLIYIYMSYVNVISTTEYNKQPSPESIKEFKSGQVLGCLVPYEEIVSNNLPFNELYRRVIFYKKLDNDYFLAFYVTSQTKTNRGFAKSLIPIPDYLFSENLQDNFKNFTQEYKKIENIGRLVRHKYFFSQLVDDNSKYDKFNNVEPDRLLVLARNTIQRYFYTPYELNTFYSILAQKIKEQNLNIDITNLEQELTRRDIDKNDKDSWSILPKDIYEYITKLVLDNSNDILKLDNPNKDCKLIDLVSNSLNDRDILEFSYPTFNIPRDSSTYYSLYSYPKNTDRIEHNDENDKKYSLGTSFENTKNYRDSKIDLLQNNISIDDFRKIHTKNEKELRIELESISHYNKNKYFRECEDINCFHITISDECCKDKRLMKALSFIPFLLNKGFTFDEIIDNFDVVFEIIDNNEKI